MINQLLSLSLSLSLTLSLSRSISLPAGHLIIENCRKRVAESCRGRCWFVRRSSSCPIWTIWPKLHQSFTQKLANASGKWGEKWGRGRGRKEGRCTGREIFYLCWTANAFSSYCFSSGRLSTKDELFDIRKFSDKLTVFVTNSFEMYPSLTDMTWRSRTLLQRCRWIMMWDIEGRGLW